MSKKISDFVTLTTLEGVDWLTGLDADQPDENLQNIKITKDNALADRQPIVSSDGTPYLGKDAAWTPAGDAATRNVGTLSTEVAAGDAPAAAVSGHESTIDHTRIQTANQKAAADAANAPSGTNAYATIADVPVISGLHDDLTDLATSGHPGTVITIPAGVPGNAVDIAADGSLQDAGKPVGVVNHADLPDLSISGHPGTVITIPAGVQGNAVAIAADGTLVDAGTPPGGTGTTNLSNTPSDIEVTVESSSGADTSIAAATGSFAGVMSAADKTKLDGLGAGGGVGKGTPFVVGDLLAVENDAGDGAIQSVGFAPGDVARLSQGNIFTSPIQRITSASDISLDLWKTGTTDRGRWELLSQLDVIALRSLSDAGFPIEANPEFRIGHGSAINRGVVLGNATFQGSGTLAAQNGVYDGADRVYSPGNPPPGSGGGIAKGTPFVVGDLLAVQSDAGDGIAQSIGVALAALMLQGGTIMDWGENGQILTATGNQTLDLDAGHFFYTSTAMTGDKVVNFQSTANHTYTAWTALIDIGAQTISWQFNSTAMRLADGYNISAGGLFLFTFVKSGSDVVVSERGVTP